MQQTLYKTATPTGPAIESGFYELFLESKVINERRVFFIREKHGWWDAANRRTICEQPTLWPEEGLSTYDEAADMYEKQVQHRVSEGFIHSFSLDFFNDDPRSFVYRNLGSGEP